MTFTVSLSPWMIVPGLLTVWGLYLMFRKNHKYDIFSPIIGLAAIGGALLFVIGRCFA